MPTLPFIKKGHPAPPRMRSGWLFDEVDVAVNTEECGA